VILLADFPDPRLFDAGLLASQAAQIIQAGASDLPAGDDLDPIDDGRMEWKGSFHTDPIRDLPDGKIGPYVPPSPADDDPFKGLNPLLLTLHNPDKDLDGIARLKIGDISPHLFPFQYFHHIHKTELLLYPV
jgi:hypothetical protein